MASDKKKDFFSIISDAINSFKNILSDAGQKAKDISSKAISFAKEKTKAVIDKSLDFFESFDIFRPYVQKIRSKKEIDYSDIDDYVLLKSKKILFDIDEGIISLVEGRQGQHLIVYVRLPDASVPVIFSPSFVNVKEWVVRRGIKNVNPLLLKRLSYVKLTVEYTKKTYIGEKQSDEKSDKKQKRVKERVEHFFREDLYKFPRPVHNLAYKDIALMILSYVEDRIKQGAYRSAEYGGVHSSDEIIRMKIFVE